MTWRIYNLSWIADEGTGVFLNMLTPLSVKFIVNGIYTLYIAFFFAKFKDLGDFGCDGLDCIGVRL